MNETGRASAGLFSRLLTLTLVGLIVAVAVRLLGAGAVSEAAFWVARLLFIALSAFGMWVCSMRERFLFVAAVAIGVTAQVTSPETADLANALNLAAFFAAFIVALTMVKEAAKRSGSVLKVGRYLTSRPAGRRYFAVATGGHILGVFLNFGAVSLLAPLIQKGASDDQGRIDPDLERRQISALLRGFSWILLWAPTTLAQAVLLTLFTDVNYTQLLSAGLVTSVAFILLGRAIDVIEWRGKPKPALSVEATDMPGLALAKVSGVCIGLIACTFLLMVPTGYTVAEALVFVAPLVTVMWLLVQGTLPDTVTEVLSRAKAMGPIMVTATPELARSAIALGLSGFIGRVAGKILPVEAIAETLNIAAMPCWLFLAALPVVITLSGQVALSPILVIVFLGEVLTVLPSLPASQTQIVYALSAGWALSMTASPNATATLLISGTCGIPPTKLTWVWNSHYALACYSVLTIVFIAICA